MLSSGLNSPDQSPVKEANGPAKPPGVSLWGEREKLQPPHAGRGWG